VGEGFFFLVKTEGVSSFTLQEFPFLARECANDSVIIMTIFRVVHALLPLSLLALIIWLAAWPSDAISYIFEGEDGGAGDRAGDFDVTLIRVIAITLSSTLIPLLRGPKDKQSTMILAVLYTALFAYALLTSCFRRQVTFILGSSVIVVCLIGLGYAADGFRSDNPASATATFLPETTGTDEELGDVNKKDSSESLNDDSLTSPLLPQQQQQEDEQQQRQQQQSKKSNNRRKATMRLLKLAAPQKMTLYAGCLVLLVRLPFSLSIPHFVASSLGHLSTSDYDAARDDVLYLLLCGTIDAMLDFWCVYLFGVANQRIIKTVRLTLFQKILGFEVGFFDKNKTGELISRLTADTTEMAGDLTWFFRFSIESIVRISGIVTYMLITSPKLGFVACTMIPIIAAINKRYGSWLHDNSKKVQSALAAANATATETLSCITTVISFAGEDYEYKKYNEKVEANFLLSVKQIFMQGVYYMVVSTFLINTIVQGSLLLAGGMMVKSGDLGLGVLIAFMLYQSQLQSEVLNLFQSYTSLVKSSGAGDKVFQLIDRKSLPPATASAGTTPLQNATAGFTQAEDTIEFKDLSFSYPSRPNQLVLRNLSFKIPLGSTYAFVGSSGSGKSTIMSLMSRFYDPVAGSLMVEGTNLKEIDLKDWRRGIGIVTQDPVLFSGSIARNIAYGEEEGDIDYRRVEEAASLANAKNFIEGFEEKYETNVGERGVCLSGGQKQRIAIARSIYRKPRLLLLDEATSALDTER